MEIPFLPERIELALTSVYRALVFLTPPTTPPTLITALKEHFPHVDPESWPTMIARGGTYLNGECVLEDRTLPSPCRIEFYEPKGEDDAALLSLRERIGEYVVFEDDELLVVYKPYGLSSMPTREQRTLNLKSFLQDYLARTSPSSSLHMPSRVDTSVEGLVVTSKSARMHGALQRVFEHRRIQKTYVLETCSSVSWEGLSATRAIERDPRHPILRRAVPEGGKPAQTEFRVLSRGSNPDRTIIEARPVTGRTHQIRVHAASYGFPITGDNFYAGAVAERLHLVSYQSEFMHPHTHRPLSLVAPPHLMPNWLRAGLPARVS